MNIINIFFLISIVIFLISLSQKTYCTDGNCGDFGGGLLAFLTGIFGIFMCRSCLVWLANPIIILSWIVFDKNEALSLNLSIFALVIGISFLFFKEIIVNEAGHLGKITGYKLGYWLWVLSMAINFLANMFKHFYLI